MKIDEIVDITGARLEGDVPNLEVNELCYAAGDCAAGSLFFCIKGANHDGHDFASAAVAGGAVALVVERPTGESVPHLIVENTRRAMSALASPFFGDPSRDLPIAGVTGTNGKTTTSFFLDSIFRSGGSRAGLIGTVEVRVGSQVQPGIRTTPESIDLQRLFRRMLNAGVRACAMEVTSEGVEAGRVEGTTFEVAIFTNLTQDHLNFHGTMENYYAAKRKLFEPGRSQTALINADDEWGKRLLGETEIEAVSFGLSGDCDLRAEILNLDPSGSRFLVKGRKGGLDGLDVELVTQIPGRFNVYNALAAAGAAVLMGFDPDQVAQGITGLASVPGRFEPVSAGQNFGVVVDYAHTPDSLENVLEAARHSTAGRVIVVFGCGGDRDRAKRPVMGAIAGRRADFSIVTSDNPRSEDPETIVSQIEAGIEKETEAYAVVVEREKAIRQAIAMAKPGDLVLIAGKGHEQGQEINGVKHPFDDRVVAAQALRDLQKGDDR